MSKQTQEKAKNEIRELLEKYDVRYIDYDAIDDDYTIRLEKPEPESFDHA